MKIGGLWLLVFGYTLAYVGWNNLNGQTISFVGAIHGDTPTANAASAMPSVFDVLGNPLGTLGNLFDLIGKNGQQAAPQSLATTPQQPQGGVSTVMI